MYTRQIFGENRCPKHERTRYSARAIIIQDGKLLLSQFAKEGIYMLPGGGLEEGETIEECCLREVQEETGYYCKILSTTLKIEEYYGEMCFIGQYFICEIIGPGAIQLTTHELSQNLVWEWMELAQARKLFASYQTFADHWEKESTYLRDHIALSYSLDHVKL